MGQHSTAIVHLRDRSGGGAGTTADRGDRADSTPVVDGLRSLRGVVDVDLEAADEVLKIRFDRTVTGLGDIVRLVEDAGAQVAGIARRG